MRWCEEYVECSTVSPDEEWTFHSRKKEFVCDAYDEWQEIVTAKYSLEVSSSGLMQEAARQSNRT
jgi:hypothetical protein